MTAAWLRFALLLVMLTGVFPMRAQDGPDEQRLVLPTDNDALFRGGGAEFYQHVVREFKGVTTRPWQGGQYGFVRNPRETGSGLVYTRFHEGIDIRPVRRDASREPLDEVRAIAAGIVAYVNLVPRFSNYGKYVVVEHRWDGASYYSLYGHLASIAVQPGNKVERGGPVGLMGYTGDGLDQSRAHLHLELNLLLSRRFESWHDHFIKTDPNRHGMFNGINLTGIDLARFYLAQRKQPSLTVPQFLARDETSYKVRLPASSNFDLPKRYPWLLRTAVGESPASWELSFSRAGIPLKLEPAETAVSTPVLSYAKKRGGNLADTTRGIIAGSGENGQLSESGLRLMRLLIWPD